MAKSAQNRKNRVSRKLRLEQLETRRVFAGLAFDSVALLPAGVEVRTVASDSHGNTYVGGHFSGTIDFDPNNQHPGNADVLSARGVEDAFVAKLNTLNELVWVNRLGGDSEERPTSGTDRVTAIKVNNSGTVWLTGTFAESADFGSTILTSAGERDVFVTQLDSAGVFQWADRFGGEGYDMPVSEIVVDTAGNVTVGGRTSGVTPAARYLRQYDSSGSLNWSHDGSSTSRASIDEIESDAIGNIYVVGGFLGNADLNLTLGEDRFPGVGEFDNYFRNTYVSQYAADGSYQWTTTLIPVASGTNPESVGVRDIAVNDLGEVVLVGTHINGSVNIITPNNPVAQPLLMQTSDQAGYFVKLDATGELQVARQYWTSADAGPLEKIVVGASGYYATVRIANSKSFSPAPGITISGFGSIAGVDGSTSLTTVLLELDDEGQVIDAGRVGGIATASRQTFFPTELHRNLSGQVSLVGLSTFPEIEYDPNGNAVADVKSPGNFVLKMSEIQTGDQVVLLKDSFEFSNWSALWVQDSQNDWFHSTQRATTGGYSAEVDGSANNATLTIANVIDLSGMQSATLTFDWLIESGFDTGECLSLDISTNGGASWIQDVRRLNGNVSPEDVWHNETVDLTPFKSSQLMIRYRSKVSASDEDANVDNVRIVGIVDSPNATPIANAGSGYTMNEGGSITLSGAGSSDPDGNIASYAWDLDGDGLYDDASGISPVYSTTISGTHVIGLQVTDNRGATATATTTVLVNNVAPTPNAGSDVTGAIGQLIALNAAGSSDPGQDIVSYLWDFDNDGNYDDATGISAVFTSSVAGVFTIGLQVVDADGAVGFDSLMITVTSVPVLSTKFYVVDDASTDRTFEYAANGAAVENYGLASGNTAPRGAASTVAGDKVWVVDAKKKVYVYNDSGVLLGSWSAGSLASNATVEGIATNGVDVWLVDAAQDRVYRYANAAGRLSGSQNATSSFALNSGNRNPKDIVTDGTHLWVVNDNRTDKVFKYTMTGTLVGSWTISSVNSKPTGITIDPSGASQSIWIVDNGTDRVYEYTNARSLISGSKAAATSFALAAGNGNPQGIADPPVPVTGQANAAPEETAISRSDLVITQVSSQPAHVPVIDVRGLAAVPSRQSASFVASVRFELPTTLETNIRRTPALPISTGYIDERREDSTKWKAVDDIFADVELLADIVNA